MSATVLWAQEGGGQGRRGGPGGGRGFGFGMGGLPIDKLMLLNSPEVCKEIKVTDEQKKKLDEIHAAHQEAQRGLLPARGDRDASPEERKKAREESTKKVAELRKQTEGKLVAVLEKPQVERLDQILLQQQGADGLVGENVVAALKLSSEQVQKIKGAIATRDEELGKLRGAGFGRGGGGGGGNFEEIRQKSDKLRKDADTAALGFLSKEQTEALAKLKGPAFELDRQSLMRGGFGRGGGPGGPGGRGGPGGGDSAKEKKRPPEDDSK